MDVRRLIFAGVLVGIAGCSGGGAKGAATPKAATTDASAPSAAATDAAAPPASDADAGSSSSGGRPFAGSAAEATQLITEAIDKKQEALARCVKEYRFRTHLAHAKIAINIGIDQEGRLIGVTLPKRKEDTELSACAKTVLRDAAFPASHAGVITITRSFEEMVQ